MNFCEIQYNSTYGGIVYLCSFYCFKHDDNNQIDNVEEINKSVNQCAYCEKDENNICKWCNNGFCSSNKAIIDAINSLKDTLEIEIDKHHQFIDNSIYY